MSITRQIFGIKARLGWYFAYHIVGRGGEIFTSVYPVGSDPILKTVQIFLLLIKIRITHSYGLLSSYITITESRTDSVSS